jgi:hypothetical protein
MHSTSSSHWKKEPKENESKDTKVIAFVKTKINVRLQRPKRRLSRRINLHQTQGWCRSGAPKIATPTKSVDPEKREEV